MPASWPSTLPQSMRPPTPGRRTDTRAMGSVDDGPVRIMRTSTIEPIAHQVELAMSESQWAVLIDTFYETTLSGGVLDFTWLNPWPSAGTKHFIFLTPPAAVRWSRRYNVAAATSTRHVRLVSPAVNPQRIATVQFSLQELRW